MWGLPLSAEGPDEVTRAWRPGHAGSRRRDGDGIAEPLDGKERLTAPQSGLGDSPKINSVPCRNRRTLLPAPWRGPRLETAMGTWGTGLYSSDMAADMRAVIKSALRLPFDEDRIVDILSDSERRAAAD